MSDHPMSSTSTMTMFGRPSVGVTTAGLWKAPSATATASCTDRAMDRAMTNRPRRRRRTGIVLSPPVSFQTHGDPLDRIVLRVEKPRAEVRGAARVHYGRADDVGTLVQREAARHAVVDHRLAVVVDADGFLAVDPPDGGRVRADRQAHAAHLPRAVHDGDGPEQDVGRRFPGRVGDGDAVYVA